MKCQFESGPEDFMNLHSAKTDEGSNSSASGSSNDVQPLLKSTMEQQSTTAQHPDGFVGNTKFTVTRVLETTTASGDSSPESDPPPSENEPLLTNGTTHLDPPHSLGPTGLQNVSSDSGFESIEKMPIVSTNGDSTTDVAAQEEAAADEEATDILRALRNEETRLNNNNDDNNEQDEASSCDTKHKTSNNAKAKKNRTTTVNTTVDEPILEPMVINKYDGLQDVLYYIDENGSPKIREKFNKKSRVKKEREQKKKLTYGTEADIADAFVFDEKTASCVSFSRLCKRFKNTFSKCVYLYCSHSLKITIYLSMCAGVITLLCGGCVWGYLSSSIYI